MSLKEIMSIAGMESLRIIGNGASLILAIDAINDISKGNIGSYIAGVSKGVLAAFAAYNLNFTEKYNYKIKSRNEFLRSLKKLCVTFERNVEDQEELAKELHGETETFSKENYERQF